VKRFVDPSPTRRVGLVWRSSFPRHKAIDVIRQAILDCRLPGTSIPSTIAGAIAAVKKYN
jgi:LysR family hydrogen peroxide-inducible transcriptional activator